MKNKKGTILIYIIILTTISLILWVIVMDNASILIMNQKNNLLNTKLSNNIQSKINQKVKKIKETNSDWGWFIDNLSWSWANIHCRLQWDWTFLLEWDEWTKLLPDWIDDNCNDDNYYGNNNSWINYPNNFEDNDDFSRKNIFWLITPKTTENIFWNNNSIEKYIDENSNNSWITNIKLWETISWNLLLDLDTSINIKIIEYDKDKYTNFKEIKKIKTYTGSVSWIWYIEENSNIVSLNSNITWNTIEFDFQNSWYMIFLTNDSDTDFVKYNLSWVNGSWKKIFLSPIKDDENNFLEILGYDLIINSYWGISSKIKKYIFEK